MPRSGAVYLALAAVILTLTAAALASTALDRGARVNPLRTGVRTVPEVAPDFKLKVITPEGLTDREFTFSSTRGSVVFLDFAFSWCPHCNNMAPIIKRLYQEYSQKGVVFVTVMGSSGSSPSASASFLSRHGVSWTALYDERMSVFSLYGVTGTPTYFVIDSDGRIVTKLIGEQPYDTLKSAIEQALGG